MFDLKLFGNAMRGVYFDNQDGRGGATDNSAGAGGDKTPDVDGKTGDDKNAKDKATQKIVFSAEQQTEVDRIVKERLDRERKKSEEAAEKARKTAEEEALSKNQEYQKLAETRQATITELEAKLKEKEVSDGTLKKYQEAVTNLVKTQVAKLPKPVKILVEKMDPLEQLQYIAENAKELNIEIKAVPETETDETKQNLQKEELEKIRKKNTGSIQRLFH